MRRIGGQKPGTDAIFIPAAFGNRKDDDPVTVVYRVPTARERRLLRFSGQTYQVNRGKDGKPSVTTTHAQHEDRIDAVLRELVVRVENYYGPNGPIATGADLAAHGEDEIIHEVYDELMSVTCLTGDEREKSEGSSSSGESTTQASNATATSAPKPGSTSTATAMGGATLNMSTQCSED